MKRYPIEPLAALLNVAPGTALHRLGVSGSTAKQYREQGVSERVADRLSCRAGYHPSEVWPEWVDDQMEAAKVACDECGARFLPTSARQRFCERACADRNGKRRRYQNPETRERILERKRKYNAECVNYKNAAERRRYWADPERQRARKRKQSQGDRPTMSGMDDDIEGAA